MPVPQQFSLSQNGLVNAADNYQNVGWRTFFVDNQVKTLISEALVNNRDLRMATLKVQEARAQYRLTDADRYPQLNQTTASGRRAISRPSSVLNRAVWDAVNGGQLHDAKNELTTNIN